MLETVVVKLLAVAGIFFPGVAREVAMSQPVVEAWQSAIAVSCALDRALPDDLRAIIDSGTPVRLTFICRLRLEDGDPTAVPDTTLTHQVVRNLATGAYEIALGDRTLLAPRFLDRSSYFRLETARLWPTDVTARGERYYVEVSARLEPIFIHATGQTFDMMALWNYRTPRGRTGVFTRNALERPRRAP